MGHRLDVDLVEDGIDLGEIALMRDEQHLADGPRRVHLGDDVGVLEAAHLPHQLAGEGITVGMQGDGGETDDPIARANVRAPDDTVLLHDPTMVPAMS
jgi:hypothetical protein